jgi:hypothetical protein
MLQDLLNSSFLFLQLLHLKTLATPSSLLLQVFKSLLSELNIFDSQFFADDGQISDWVNISFNVNDFSIVEAANDLEDGVDGADV